MEDRLAILSLPAPAASEQQNIRLFRIYLAYRTILSVLLLLALLTPETSDLVGSLNPGLYILIAGFFLATNVLLLGLIRTPVINSQAALFMVFFVDILAITIMADTSGGMGSGLPILLIATAAASAVLLTNTTIATLIAALAVIALLADTLRLINEGVLGFTSMLPAGLLGSLIFSVSLLIQVVARRVGKAEELARRRAADLYNLQRLNEQIVQNLQTGILLVYADDTVRVMNQSATRLLDPERPVALEQGRSLSDYNVELARQFDDWRDSGTNQTTPIHILDDAPEIIAKFSNLQNSGQNDALVFLEDYTPVTQQAQSLKLASLGRLTASIAHEIRNPLGAVSHAAQLLNESEELSQEDRAMTRIIQQHAQRMNSIIENVLQISRRQPPTPQQLALKGWLHNFVAEYNQTLPEPADITLELPREWVEVTFDPSHLQRVLSNLLDNGLRHSRLAVGENRVNIVVKKDMIGKRCLLDVIDRGSGVEESEQAKLFEPFYTTVDKGTGLGLFLSKELCEINNATLIYRPTAEGESCFRITIAQGT